LIQPKPGTALAYVDYAQEEFLIGGVRSQDQAILKAYASGDPYVGFGIESGLIPPGGSKTTHPNERDKAKTLMLAVQYGMTSRTLAARLGVSCQRAEDLLATHRRMFHRFWKWSDQQVCSAYWTGAIETFYGWKLAVSLRTKERTIRNFRVQGDGAEILRLANIFLWELGVRVCAPVHDAVLVECPEADLEDVVSEVQRQMERASECVLDGYRLRTEARLLRYPDRLLEHRGQAMWDRIMAILDRLDGRAVEKINMGKGYR
jgi:DNA polymerase I-like protein with 3'-5' exonuclease and polymerase domains